MSKRKNFKDLFGGDDSDEENEQTEFSSTSTIGKERNKSENASNNDKYTVQDLAEIVKNKSGQRKGYSNLEKHTDYTEREHSFIDEETKNQMKKKVKIKHEDNTFQSIFYNTSTGNIEDIKEKNGLLHTKEKNGLLETKGQNSDGKKKVQLKKMEIGGLVVKLLTPAYVQKRFDSRDTFKMLARNISHALYDKGKTDLLNKIKNDNILFL